MGRKKAGNTAPDRNDKTVKFDETLARKAAYISACRRIPLAEYLTEMCRAKIEADFLKETKKTGGSES